MSYERKVWKEKVSELTWLCGRTYKNTAQGIDTPVSTVMEIILPIEPDTLERLALVAASMLANDALAGKSAEKIAGFTKENPLCVDMNELDYQYRILPETKPKAVAFEVPKDEAGSVLAGLVAVGVGEPVVAGTEGPKIARSRAAYDAVAQDIGAAKARGLELLSAKQSMFG